jgi:LPXTG-motif cell wall-anchored protein
MRTIVSARRWTMFGLGSAALTAATLVLPASPAAAAEIPALTHLVEADASGKTIAVPAKPGEVVAPVLGVANLSKAPIKGAAVQIRVLNDMDLPKTFENCQYYTFTNLEGAWCQFDEELNADGRSYALDNLRVSIAASAKELDSVSFRWVTPAEVTAAGGIEAMAKRDSFTHAAVAGTQGKLRLVERQLPPRATPHPVGFAFIRLILPTPTAPTGAPSSSAPSSSAPTATASAPASDGAAPGPTAGSGGEGGGLPLTGSSAATAAGIGGVLVLAGGAFYLLARRRRNRFTA